jgi:uncharacterized protein YjbI with pentapeptide repeats
MTNPDHLKILQQGVDAWNAWMKGNPDITPDLYEADLSGADLSGAILFKANLIRANLKGANLTRANLTRANLTRANLTRANLMNSYRARQRGLNFGNRTAN